MPADRQVLLSGYQRCSELTRCMGGSIGHGMAAKVGTDTAKLQKSVEQSGAWATGDTMAYLQIE